MYAFVSLFDENVSNSDSLFYLSIIVLKSSFVMYTVPIQFKRAFSVASSAVWISLS